ncbi:tripartite tricarboxylate transporter permease [Natronocalculus amylovorans]|uniref:Tripartite tricarboxylate transporter permease n=1 Tax=Natronocalculus amylovorans TaxID=2917812 RepID=A0AAE3KCN7_9EURY|nr:tripartite tricarboxylate transporter permease [Natronocalculus amylovorans]MCL9817904.1 tripartite tricarboxylate transporter permease [Natronocalculus amylovorans]
MISHLEFVVLFVFCAGCGGLLGVLSGLVPGLHANNFALLLAAIAPTIPIDPIFLGAAMVTAGVVHSFVDIVPALTVGVPDAAMAIAALPGHRLVLAGRGREALRISAAGSLCAVIFALVLAIPITWLMIRSYPMIRAHLWIVLASIVCILLLTERSVQAAVVALFSFGLSAALGLTTLDVDPSAPLGAGSMLMPLLTGLFGAPVLIDAVNGEGVPPQHGSQILMDRAGFIQTATAGSIAGAIVGYLPGVSAAIASVLALPAVSTDDIDRGFIVVTSGASTANTVFALFALYALGTPRTGVMVAVDHTDVPLNLFLLLPAAVFGACIGFLTVIIVGDRFLEAVGSIDPWLVSVGILGLLVLLSGGFAGIFGVGVFVVSTLVGLIPPRFNVKRVHLMGVLIGPLLFG